MLEKYLYLLWGDHDRIVGDQSYYIRFFTFTSMEEDKIFFSKIKEVC